MSDTGNLYLTGGNDRRIKLGDSGIAGESDSNNTVHIRGDNDFMKLMAAGNGGFIFEENGTERFKIASGGVITQSTGPATAGAVGTYALLWRTDSGSGYAFGDTIAGSNLRAANTYHNGAYSNWGYGSTSVSGTWRCMGNTGVYNGGTAYNSTIWMGCTVWVRVS